MTRRHSARGAFLSSLVSLLLCFSMLLGTTYAWFTDSVTSANNIIQSGTLDVSMEWANGTLAVPAADSTDWIDASSGPIFNSVLWEPGYAEVRHIKIENEGTLALKYKVSIVANGEVSDLSDVIDVYYVDPAVQVADRDALTADKRLGTLTEVLAALGETGYGELLAGEKDTITLALVMQDEAGNEYKGKSLGTTFAIQLIATQLSAEPDGFGKDYDENAIYPAVSNVISGANTYLTYENAPAANTKKTSVQVPADAFANGSELEIVVNSANTLFNIAADGAVVGSLDIVLSKNGAAYEAELADGKVFTVETYISKGLSNVSIAYVGTDGRSQPTLVSYDAATGKLVFTTSHFSEYAVSAKAIAFDVENDKAIASAVELVEAIKNGSESVAIVKELPTVDALNVAIIAKNEGVEIDHEDVNGLISDDSAKIPVSGGATFESDPTDYVDIPDGYIVADNGDGTFTVELPTARTVAQLNALLDGTNKVIYLGADLSDVDLTVGYDVVIDLSGYTITDAYIKTAANVTVKNGSIKNTIEPYPLVVNKGTLTVEKLNIEASKSDRAIWVRENGTLNFNSGSILATKGDNNSKSSIYGIWVAQGATANIYGGSITVDAGANATAVGIFGNYTNTVNVYGGRISTSGKNYSYGIWADGNVTVSGGEIITNEKQYGYSSGVMYGYNYAIYSKGTVTISDAKITTNGFSGYLVSPGQTNQNITISNVDFTNVLTEIDMTTGGHKAPSLVKNASNNNVTISGGSYKGVNNDFTSYVAEGYVAVQNGDVYKVFPADYKIKEVVADGVYLDEKGNYLIENANGLIWVADQADPFFEGKTVKLIADIYCSGYQMKPIKMWSPENRSIFDGQGYTIYDLTISNEPNGGNQSLFNGTLDIKNLTVDGAYIVGYAYHGVIAGTLYGNIENCHVKNAKLYSSYWQAGLIVGQFNSGTIKDCTVSDSYIEGPSAIGGIAGITTEERTYNFINCTVSGCTIVQNGSFGGDYDSFFGGILGLGNTSDTYNFTNCTVTDTTIKGVASDAIYGVVEGTVVEN